MAKDGTMRGGPRQGQGRPKKPLADKITDGTAKNAKVLKLPETINDGLSAGEMVGVDVPPVKDYLKAAQKNGKGMCAEEVYTETYKWLKARGCDSLVNSQLIEQYAMSVSRWIQCEEAISEFGFLARHPTTGNPISSPYVSMSQSYMKQVNQIWFQIYQIVKDNCSTDYEGSTPQDSVMERLLRARKG